MAISTVMMSRFSTSHIKLFISFFKSGGIAWNVVHAMAHQRLISLIINIKTTRPEKIQLLPLVLESQSRKSILEYYQVTEYTVGTSQSLVTVDGILSKPSPGQRKFMSSEIKKFIVDFYCNNENMRILPQRICDREHQMFMSRNGWFVVLSRNFTNFMTKHPDIKDVFSPFTIIRPKLYILAGSAAIQTVCLLLKWSQIVFYIQLPFKTCLKKNIPVDKRYCKLKFCCAWVILYRRWFSISYLTFDINNRSKKVGQE